ncbi:hypothetical protein LEP1GSC036_1641 [Leptospira weilii str. 2006001853]|uniref:Uncharacterized protein n=1 Tax=Leptospira weilii str. 2006001853 TaxID=1001589 RepID=A0A828YUC8_9LEPT|nr:hypothetical protein LEP1GSC036_1641 [Leptospira weilii str. 2006001853]EMN42616.1 hypothetical protein LEP1GSC086_1425 [Leptospira weilii str. LNT 1234]
MNRVYRRTRKLSLKIDRKRSFHTAAPNFLDQVFKSDGLDRIWFLDITYIPDQLEMVLSICDQRSFQSRDRRLDIGFETENRTPIECV